MHFSISFRVLIIGLTNLVKSLPKFVIPLTKFVKCLTDLPLPKLLKSLTKLMKSLTKLIKNLTKLVKSNVKLRDEISGMMECYIEPENSSLITHRTVTKYRKLLLKSRWSSFQDYINWRYSACLVRINVDNWREATCTCPNFLKNYICKHSLGMAIRLKALNCVVPAIAKNIPIGQKRRRGRPKLARPALIVQ